MTEIKLKTVTYERDEDGVLFEVRSGVAENGDVLEFRAPFEVSHYFDYGKDSNDETIN
jgi:hypothetical protein